MDIDGLDIDPIILRAYNYQAIDEVPHKIPVTSKQIYGLGTLRDTMTNTIILSESGPIEDEFGTGSNQPINVRGRESTPPTRIVPPEENYRIDFPIERHGVPEGITEDDTKTIISYVDNGIHTFVLSCLYWPETAFFTRYEDGQLKLNRKGGPAVVYPSGCEEYWVRGEHISDHLIEQLSYMTAREILTYPNIETRRILMECLGNDELARRMKSMLIKVNDGFLNNRLYTLYRTKDGIDMSERVPVSRRQRTWPQRSRGYMPVDMYFLHVFDASTTREYYLQVPPMRDALEALAWTFYETKETYNPVIET